MSATEQLNLYGQLYYICLGIAVIGLVLSIFFFFYFKIPLVYSMMTGRSQKKAEETMRKKKDTHGSIRMSSRKLGEGAVGAYETSGDLRVNRAEETQYHTPSEPEDILQTGVLQSPAQETSVLSQAEWGSADGGGETRPLDAGATVLLRSQSQKSGIRFEIFESVTSVNTDERI